MDRSQNSDDTDNTEYFRQYQQSSIKFMNENYTAKLPWKLEHPPLPSNQHVSKKGTENMIRRLHRQSHLLKTCDEIIVEQERRGS